MIQPWITQAAATKNRTDCWPVASWSSIDYYGRWKALQYYARRFYNDLLISPTAQNGYLKLFLVSDRPQAISAKIKSA